ncbi:MAG: peptidoglycan DD-metalloendopeptidase family protein [Acidobacteria bacterium]|nr:peptidoglycan DD-metalloendopeptidase family protein [Acidobacteriota bacterium]
MKIFKQCVLLSVLVGTSPVLSTAQEPSPGPYYFVSDNVPGPGQFYWGGADSYGGIRVIENLNLLAAVLADDPATRTQAFWFLVDQESFDFGSDSVLLQPFAYRVFGFGKKQNLSIGPNLRAFLTFPLGGAAFDLTLPFCDPRVALSDASALLRVLSGPRTWHTAVDLDVTGGTSYTGGTSQGFDVLAPSDGIVFGNTGTDTLCLRHIASNGREFLTVYSHIVPASKSHLPVGTQVARGQVIGSVQEPGGAYTHLHFGVAVKGPSRTINSMLVPELWYLIDPFGVYDYRRNRFSQTDYNYVPNNTMAMTARGVRHAYVWRTNPPLGSLPPCTAVPVVSTEMENQSTGR